MLTLHTGSPARDCAGLSRRHFLRAGTLALGGLSLPWLLETRAKAAAADPAFVKDKAVVVVFLGGGASHIETFNPNMDGPESARSVTGEVKTALPGVTFGGTFPKLAECAKHAIVVRSFAHPVGNHEQAISHVLTGGTDASGQAKEGHSIGSLYARVRGSNHPKTGLPTYALLTDPHKDPQYNRERERVVVGSRSGPLGPACEPFVPGGKGPATRNMELAVPADRFAERLELLRGFDEVKRTADTTASLRNPFEQQALDLLLRGAGQAFDVSKEPKSVRDRYDTSSFKTGKKTFEPCVIGSQFLLARRLLEAGVGFVTVQSAGWDMHADGNNPGVKDGMEMLGPPLDKGLSAFLTDLHERGLLEKTLVVLTGDFGRTPKVNKTGGRDHWPNLCTLALFGGGLKTGQVVGRSARDNGAPATTPVTPAHLMATVMHHLFDAGAVRTSLDVPTAIANLVAGEPIPGVF
ncbi:MAG: DUF1501 domain-containing protein [Gemmataceae bacterium]|nr:DUF1501 domain-containing protein [Gemmataceae bacterium]